MQKKTIFTFIFCCIQIFIFPQQNTKSSFYKYKKYRTLIANWQINQLADSGALVVRLKSNKKTLDILKKNNQTKAAKELEQLTYFKNKKIVRAFTHHYHFSKVYFIYDYSYDSLLNNFHVGFFLDSTLARNSNIKFQEKFYLIAEQDYVVQSSIGLVPDSVAKKTTETGAPVKQAAIVIKNKYGIQLKSPFPYYVPGTNINKYDLYVTKLVSKLNKFKQKSPRLEYPVNLYPYMY